MFQPRRALAAIVLSVAFGVPVPAWAQTSGDIATGAQVAQRQCANCHIVSSAQRAAPMDGAPTFHAIAANPFTTAVSLRTVIEIPHPRMANQMLSRQEVSDVIAYILSLRPQ